MSAQPPEHRFVDREAPGGWPAAGCSCGWVDGNSFYCHRSEPYMIWKWEHMAGATVGAP
jgi:hypothetical protein